MTDDCMVCEKIAKGKVISIVDLGRAIAIFPAKAMTFGHVKIFPKNHALKLEELDDETVAVMFSAASSIASSLFELLDLDGTNIIVNENHSHICIDIIPRKENDGISFTWPLKRMTPDEANDVYARLSAAMPKPSAQPPAQQPAAARQSAAQAQQNPPGAEFGAANQQRQMIYAAQEEKAKQTGANQAASGGSSGAGNSSGDKEKKDDVVKVPTDSKVNYLIKQLTRIP